ncbi:MAG TPA: hypothetical protein PKJ15_07510 [Methanomassiliicoccales archaeon]|jgi:hypothetical protein|nr:hypothetical protein [Methanomassiliicoccales archaeon]
MDELRNEPILLAHHPLCGRFDDHLLTVRGRKICRGCVTVYPTFLVMLVLLSLSGPTFEAAFLASLLLFSFQLMRFVASGRWTAILFNVVLGSSLAMVIYSAIVCPPELRIYVYPFIITVIVVFEYLKGRRMLDRCKECPSYASYPLCARGPGKPED